MNETNEKKNLSNSQSTLNQEQNRRNKNIFGSMKNYLSQAKQSLEKDEKVKNKIFNLYNFRLKFKIQLKIKFPKILK